MLILLLLSSSILELLFLIKELFSFISSGEIISLFFKLFSLGEPFKDNWFFELFLTKDISPLFLGRLFELKFEFDNEFILFKSLLLLKFFDPFFLIDILLLPFFSNRKLFLNCDLKLNWFGKLFKLLFPFNSIILLLNEVTSNPSKK